MYVLLGKVAAVAERALDGHHVGLPLGAKAACWTAEDGEPETRADYRRPAAIVKLLSRGDVRHAMDVGGRETVQQRVISRASDVRR